MRLGVLFVGLSGLMLLWLTHSIAANRSADSATPLILNRTYDAQLGETFWVSAFDRSRTRGPFVPPYNTYAYNFGGWANYGTWLYFNFTVPSKASTVTSGFQYELWRLSLASKTWKKIDVFDAPVLPPSPTASQSFILGTGNSGPPGPPYFVVTWSPDGEWLLYPKANPQGTIDLIRRRSDGSDPLNLTNGQVSYLYYDYDQPLKYSPDGQWVYFAGVGANGFQHVFRANLRDGGVEDITARIADDISLAYVLPDGNWLLMVSRQNGVLDTYWKMHVDGGAFEEFVSPFGMYGRGGVAAYFPKSQIFLFADSTANSTRAFRWPDGEPLWGYPNARFVSASPDNEWVVMGVVRDESAVAWLVVMHPDGSDHRELGLSSMRDYGWTSDGQWLLVYSLSTNPSDKASEGVWRVRMDGYSEPLIVSERGQNTPHLEWTHDHEWLGVYNGMYGHAALPPSIPAFSFGDGFLAAKTIEPHHWEPALVRWLGIGLVGLCAAGWIRMRPKAARLKLPIVMRLSIKLRRG